MKRRAHRYRDSLTKRGYQYARMLEVGAQALRRRREVAVKVEHMHVNPSERLNLVQKFGEACIKGGLPFSILQPIGRSASRFRMTRIRLYCCTSKVVSNEDSASIAAAIEAAELALSKCFVND